MYCGECGSKIADDARFCPACGAKTGASDGCASAGVGQQEGARGAKMATAKDVTTGDLGTQVKANRARSRRRLPQLILIALVVATLASATAFAATWVYRTYFAPQLAEQQQEETVTPAQPADPTLEQKAVFNDVLSHYKGALDGGWPETSYDEDLSNVSEVLSGRAHYMGQAHETDFSGATLSYAYKDLDGDGTLELVIAAVSADEYMPVAAYGNHGGVAQSLFGGQGWQTSVWTLYQSGKVVLSGGGTNASATVYALEDGAAVETGTYTYRLGESVPDLGTPYASSDFEWTPLSNYQPVG